MGEQTYPLGIDVGGSGIKGAPVDVAAGEFAADRVRIETPAVSTPENVVEVIARIAETFAGQTGTHPIGVTVPGVVTRGVVRSAANIDKSWIDADAAGLLRARIGRDVTVLNDGDAAGVAEMHFGAGKGVSGTVVMATLGTGIGTAVFVDGKLVPNTEFGHLELDGHDAESRAANSAREREELSWGQWARRLQRYFTHLEDLLWPDLIIVGGGVSKKAHKFIPKLDLRTQIIPAVLQNDAGIIGAAWQAVEDAKVRGLVPAHS